MIHIKLFIARFILFSLGAILLLCDKTYEFTYNNHDFAFWNHGMYNLIFFLLLLFFNLCIILFFKFAICLYKIQKKIQYNY
jgi:hypothetical protein